VQDDADSHNDGEDFHTASQIKLEHGNRHHWIDPAVPWRPREPSPLRTPRSGVARKRRGAHDVPRCAFRDDHPFRPPVPIDDDHGGAEDEGAVRCIV
jgi:hypothetical protein